MPESEKGFPGISAWVSMPDGVGQEHLVAALGQALQITLEPVPDLPGADDQGRAAAEPAPAG